MKNFIKRWSYAFAITSAVLFLLNIIIIRRLNINFNYPRIYLTAFLIALFVTFSITLFNLTKGSDFVKTILGLIVLFPIPLILRRVYGVIIFRFSFIIYVAFVLCVIIYTISVFIVLKKVKSEEKTLNQLLDQTNQNNDL